jgi:hypothetical protein
LKKSKKTYIHVSIFVSLSYDSVRRLSLPSSFPCAPQQKLDHRQQQQQKKYKKKMSTSVSNEKKRERESVSHFSFRSVFFSTKTFTTHILFATFHIREKQRFILAKQTWKFQYRITGK